MNAGELGYLGLVTDVLENGERKDDRTGTGTLELFAPDPLRYDLTYGFPCFTTKKVNYRVAIAEMLFFMYGQGNTKWLNDRGIHLWDAWSRKDGDLGPIYGVQMRDWWSHGESHDQLTNLVNDLAKNPTGRRHIVSYWNVGELNYMALPPCHTMFQVHRNMKHNKIDLALYQRSNDLMLGTPFNTIGYAMLIEVLAYALDAHPGKFTHFMGSAHVYLNHVDGAREQIDRVPFEFPVLGIDHEAAYARSRATGVWIVKPWQGKHYGIPAYEPEDFEMLDYYHEPAIKFDVSV